MKSEELQRRLGHILAEEEVPPSDWDAVAVLSAQLIDDAGVELSVFAKDYLVSWQRRRNDPLFAQAQRSSLIQYLRSGGQ